MPSSASVTLAPLEYPQQQQRQQRASACPMAFAAAERGAGRCSDAESLCSHLLSWMEHAEREGLSTTQQKVGSLPPTKLQLSLARRLLNPSCAPGPALKSDPYI